MIAEAERGISRRLAGQRYRLRPSTILALHRAAVDGIDAYAGAYRPGGVTISRSHHAPPPADAVAEMVEDLCDWVNDHWDDRAPTELAARVLWEICWIHPFTDGNGRTARAVAYLVLLVAYGLVLPGTLTVPEQISEDRRPYYAALEAADTARDETGVADVSAMAAYLEGMVERQLETVRD
ncbi:MAG: Fic family protein [Pseudomonadota bacterium]